MSFANSLGLLSEAESLGMNSGDTVSTRVGRMFASACRRLMEALLLFDCFLAFDGLIECSVKEAGCGSEENNFRHIGSESDIEGCAERAVDSGLIGETSGLVNEASCMSSVATICVSTATQLASRHHPSLHFTR